MKRALVTGGLGFIGSNLVRELVARGYTVEIIDDLSNGHIEFLKDESSRHRMRVIPVGMLGPYLREVAASGEPAAANGSDELMYSNPLVITGDFAHDDVLARVRDGFYDTIFHLAANPRVEYSVNNPTETTEQNVLKTVGLFEVAAKSGTRVVFASSSAVYGDCSELPTAEAVLKVPNSPYGLQKYVCEQFARLMAGLYDLDAVCLRYFNVYGPRQYGISPYSTAICSWCDKVKSEQPLRSDGDGLQSRDLVYVGDVVNANILAAESDINWKGEPINVASGTSYTNKEILNKFQDKFSDVDVVAAPRRAGDVMHTKADVATAARTLGFQAQVGMDEGLARTWEWWGLS